MTVSISSILEQLYQPCIILMGISV